VSACTIGASRDLNGKFNVYHRGTRVMERVKKELINGFFNIIDSLKMIVMICN